MLSILIIEADALRGRTTTELVERAASLGFEPSIIEAADAIAMLKESIRSERSPHAVVLAPNIGNPVALAREIRSVWQSGHFIFVREAGAVDGLRRELGRTLMIGTDWSLAQSEDPLISTIVSDAARASQRRRKLRTTLDRANIQIAAHKTIDSVDYRRLLLSEHYLASFLSQARDAIIGLDSDLNILYWNAGAERLFEQSAKNMLGLPAHRLPCWSAESEQALRAIRGGENVVTKELACSLSNGQAMLEIAFSAVLDDAGKFIGVSVIARDVTVRHQEREAETAKLERLVVERTAELRKAELALHQSQKLEAIGKLTGGVAHDFNNILQVIGSNLDLLSINFAGEDKALHRIRNAIAAVDRGSKLSSHLLSYARRQPLKPAPTNLGRVLRELDDLLRRVLGEAVEIETVIGGGLWTSMVDRNQIENVIINLAINARDAMDGAGKLTLELGNTMLDDHYARQHADVVAGQYVMLAVTDTGAGMKPEVLERAFEPFFTTKREGEGTGLGLSMAYGFVKQSEGHIKIYSELGNGTTIKIYLPRSHQAEAAIPDLRNLPVSGGMETILVVEDDLAVQATVVDILTGLGYKVLKAPDAQSALTILQSGMTVDLLFTDVVMPGPMRTPELARLAKELLPKIKILFTSGYTQNAIVHGGRLDPGVELISKPYRHEDLARKIRQVFANEGVER